MWDDRINAAPGFETLLFVDLVSLAAFTTPTLMRSVPRVLQELLVLNGPRSVRQAWVVVELIDIGGHFGFAVMDVATAIRNGSIGAIKWVMGVGR